MLNGKAADAANMQEALPNHGRSGFTWDAFQGHSREDPFQLPKLK